MAYSAHGTTVLLLNRCQMPQRGVSITGSSDSTDGRLFGDFRPLPLVPVMDLHDACPGVDWSRTTCSKLQLLTGGYYLILNSWISGYPSFRGK